MPFQNTDVPFFEPSLCEAFHRNTAATVARECVDDVINCTWMMIHIQDANELLAANPDRVNKPDVFHIAACIYMYKTDSANFNEVVMADPHLAMWVSHFFRCRVDDEACTVPLCSPQFPPCVRNRMVCCVLGACIPIPRTKSIVLFCTSVSTSNIISRTHYLWSLFLCFVYCITIRCMLVSAVSSFLILNLYIYICPQAGQRSLTATESEMMESVVYMMQWSSV